MVGGEGVDEAGVGLRGHFRVGGGVDVVMAVGERGMMVTEIVGMSGGQNGRMDVTKEEEEEEEEESLIYQLWCVCE